MQVGTRELKNRLSHYLRLVRSGEPIEVTDRGIVVAEIRAAQPPANNDEACLAEMERVGLVTRGRGHVRNVTPVTPRRGRKLSEVCIEDRR
jgi:antitoxin (DNA-binding transcriptional repressor) of toxin-antitoxin stability system